ncbi:gp33 family protein [Nitrospira sp. Nam74]
MSDTAAQDFVQTLLRDFLYFDKVKKEHEAEAKKAGKAQDAIEQQLLAWFERAGLRRMTTRDGTTIYVHRQLWARGMPGNKPAAVAALKDSGLEDMVEETFNTQRLSAWVREEAKKIPNGDTMGPAELLTHLPPAFAGSISIDEDIQLRATKGD